MRRSRRIAALSALALAPGLLALQAAGPASGAAPVVAAHRASLLHPAEGVRRARITITEHGIPHIVAKDYESLGYGRLPVCVAKTQNSLSDDPKRPGRPRGFTITIRDAALSAGAGFVVAYAGDILTMPGLPKVPGAEGVDIDANGNVVGLF
jgi:hypothetical protein